LSEKIEIGFHIRTPDRLGGVGHFFDHLEGVYGSAFLTGKGCKEEIALDVTRLYIGDEFCPHRLPDPKQLDAFFVFAEENRLALTLLTPPLSDRELERFSALWTALNQSKKNIEVVVNDLGVLLFLRQEFPCLQVSAGRLLNKAFKDPRLADAAGLASFSTEAAILLNGCTYDNEAVQTLLTGYDIRRIEGDLLPYGHGPFKKKSNIETSLYFPYGAITFGRVCWMSTLSMPEEFWYMPMDQCSSPCEGVGIELKNDNFAFQVFQYGNAVFYLYPWERITDLFETAVEQEMRLVYQGFAFTGDF
jgi:hypothetical protein